MTTPTYTGGQAINETGVTYHLPTARIELVISDDGSQFYVDMLEPEYSADPKLPALTARFVNNWAAADDIKIEVDDQGLLKKITLTSDSQLDDVFTNIAKSAVAIYAPTKESGIGELREVARLTIDPGSMSSAQITAEIGRLVGSYISSRDAPLAAREAALTRNIAAIRGDKKKAAELNSLSTSLNQVQSERANLVSAKYTQSRMTFDVDSFYAGLAKPTDLSICEKKFCTRQTVAYELSIGGQSTILNLPNNAPVLAMDINRALVGTRTHTQDFTNGLLVTNQTATPAELVDLTEIPFELINAWGTGLISSRTARINELDSRLNLKNKQLDYDTRLLEINDAREALGTDTAGETDTTTDATDTPKENAAAPGTGTSSQRQNILRASFRYVYPGFNQGGSGGGLAVTPIGGAKK